MLFIQSSPCAPSWSCISFFNIYTSERMSGEAKLTTPIRLSAIIADKSPSITRDDCSYYGRVNTTGFGLIRSYEGIPENLLMNLVVSSVWKDLLVQMIVIRRANFRSFYSSSCTCDDGFQTRRISPMEQSKQVVPALLRVLFSSVVGYRRFSTVGITHHDVRFARYVLCPSCTVGKDTWPAEIDISFFSFFPGQWIVPSSILRGT
jgi:hypothetical protein